MSGFIQLLAFVTIGVALLWFGYSLLMGQWAGIRRQMKGQAKAQHPAKGAASAGDPQVCPICSTMLAKGDLVKTLAFPSISGGKDRLMHIRGCMYCIDGELQRTCPVCGGALSVEGILVARMFERPHRHPHVHVLGCSRCRRLGVM